MNITRIFNRFPLTTILVAVLLVFFAVKYAIGFLCASDFMQYFSGLAYLFALIYVFGGIFILDRFLTNYFPILLPAVFLFDLIVFSKPKSSPR